MIPDTATVPPAHEHLGVTPNLLTGRAGLLAGALAENRILREALLRECETAGYYLEALYNIRQRLEKLQERLDMLTNRLAERRLVEESSPVSTAGIDIVVTENQVVS